MGSSIPWTGSVTPTDPACADTLFRLGLRLSNRGEGHPTDPVRAQALFDLAARLGSIEAKVYRRELSEEMDPAQIDEARDLARAWRREPVLTSADILGA
jgi:hypothetical protein